MNHTRPWITAGVALVGAGLIAAPVAPAAGQLAAVAMPGIQLTAADMVLDLVRHAESVDNVTHVLGTTPPGVDITDLGKTQAAFLADPTNPQHLSAPSFYDGIFASELIRTQQTADGWLTAAGSDLQPTVLSGLNELNAGTLEGTTPSSQAEALQYMLAPLAWMFGQYWVPQLGSTIDPNGMAFNDRFTDAIDTIYNSSTPGADGQLNDVAFSHAAAISTWVMMNVKNPDFGMFFQSLQQGLLPNTGQVVIEGNPTDGWTLVSWNGQEVAENPGLLTGLFVDFRDLMVAPQMAGWHISQAFEGGDPTEIMAALQTGFNDVFSAIMAFPQAVIETLTSAAGDAASSAEASGDVFGDLFASLSA